MGWGRIMAAVGLALLLFSASAAAAQQAIGPNQHFDGLVNDSHRQPVVYTVCAGPSAPGRTGRVARGQTFAVAEVADGQGYTGLFKQVYAWFVPTSSQRQVVQVRLTRYGVRKSIPTTVRVPCQGAGTVEFSSCPYLAPCAAGWVPEYVDVQFVNIAA